MIGKQKIFRKVQIEFELTDNYVIPPKALPVMKELFDGCGALICKMLMDREKIPTKYKVTFEK